MANGLGRGLNSLIPQKNTNDGAVISSPVLTKEEKDKVLQIDIDKLSINTLQPRKQFTDVEMEELANSIREYGIIQPLIVTQKGTGYEIIAGERRFRAAKIVGLKKVPAIMRDVTEQSKLEVALIENIQRQNLNPIDLAAAYKKLIDEFSLSQDEVAKKLGKSRPVVTNTLRMLTLPEEIRLALIEGKITEGHAKYIVGLDTEAKQLTLFRKILHTNLSVDHTSQEARRMGGTKAARIKINYRDKDKEFALREFFGAKVEIKRKGKGGQIVIDFYSDDELEELIGKVKK